MSEDTYKMIELVGSSHTGIEAAGGVAHRAVIMLQTIAGIPYPSYSDWGAMEKHLEGLIDMNEDEKAKVIGNLRMGAVGLGVIGALIGGPGVLLTIPIFWAAIQGAKNFAENADRYPLGPDGQPTNRGCRYCGSPIGMVSNTCARCGRKQIS